MAELQLDQKTSRTMQLLSKVIGNNDVNKAVKSVIGEGLKNMIGLKN